MRPHEYIKGLQAARPARRVEMEKLSERARRVTAELGIAVEDVVRQYHDNDYAARLMQVLMERLPTDAAAVFDPEVVAVGTVEDPNPNLFVKRLGDEGYAIVFNSGLRDLLYRMARVLATRMFVQGEPANESGLEDTARLIAEVFWWLQESGMAFGPDYSISNDQIIIASRLAQEAEIFLLAHELGHILHEQSRGELIRQLVPDLAQRLGPVPARHLEEYSADSIAVRLALGLREEGERDASRMMFTYAGIELGLQVHRALAQLGFELGSSHPPAAERIANIRAVASASCATSDVWRILSSFAMGLDGILTNVLHIIEDPGEHRIFFDQQAEAIGREFQRLLRECSDAQVPDYAAFHARALALLDRGYSHTLLEPIADVVARFVANQESHEQSRAQPDEPVLQNFRQFKLLLSLIEGMGEPARSVFRAAFNRHIPALGFVGPP